MSFVKKSQLRKALFAEGFRIGDDAWKKLLATPGFPECIHVAWKETTLPYTGGKVRVGGAKIFDLDEVIDWLRNKAPRVHHDRKVQYKEAELAEIDYGNIINGAIDSAHNIYLSEV